MGVSIYVGFYAQCVQYDPDIALTIDQQLNSINKVLSERGLEEHVEPRTLGKMNNRADSSDFSYAKLFQLRQFYLDLIEGSPSESHLVCHSDFDGFYLPINFDTVIKDKDGKIAGTWLGSSYGLIKELVHVAPVLGISLTDGLLSDETADEVNDKAWSSSRYSDELMAWIALYEAARLSIEHNSAIVFR